MQQVKSIQAVQSQRARGSRPEISLQRRRRDSGALLLAVLFIMAVMVIVALAVAPAVVMQIKRDREAEMIHRGTEYARAIKKFYKKFGRYPANLEQLDNTNQIRFLRRRYKDPLSKGGEWKLLHYGDIALLVGANGVGTSPAQLAAQQAAAAGGGQNANLTSGASGGDQGANTAPTGAQLSPQQPGTGTANLTPGVTQPGSTSPFVSGAGGAGATGQTSLGQGAGTTQPGGLGGTQGATGPAGQAGSNNTIFGNTGVGGQTFGGGAVVGVASNSKDPTIRIFNKKKTYDEWQFIYSPAMDTAANTLLRGPYNGQVLGNAQQIGTPAGQLNQGQTGQQPGALGQHPGGPGQQNPQQNQQLTPGGQFPPDQSQQQ